MTEVSQVQGSEAASQSPEQIPKDVRNWATACHLAGLGWLLWWIVPFVGGVLGSLILWLIKKDEHGFISEQGKEALNFQISMLIYWLASGLLCLCGIGLVLIPIIAVVDFVLTIAAAIRANSGRSYRYPLTIRLVN